MNIIWVRKFRVHQISIYLGFYTIFLAGDAFAYWALAWYFDTILSGSFGASKPWYYPITDTWNYFLQATGWKSHYDLTTMRASLIPDDVAEGDMEGYTESVHPSLRQKGQAVRIRNLVKEFRVGGETKRAVDNLSLDIYRSEIFALLG